MAIHPSWTTAPRLWRFLLRLAAAVIGTATRLTITGTPPTSTGPLILAGNHIGLFDPIALAAACGRQRIAPRFMATAGITNAPVIGSALRASGIIGVDRASRDLAAFHAAEAALNAGDIIAVYPEGRITLDPGCWPERGKTGVARLATLTGATVIPVSIWGSHEVIAYEGLSAAVGTVLRTLIRRPEIQIHFGTAVSRTSDHPRRYSDQIMRAITDNLRQLRSQEPELPHYRDPTRPVSATHRLNRGVTEERHVPAHT